jgi:hypothetical protein
MDPLKAFHPGSPLSVGRDHAERFHLLDPMGGLPKSINFGGEHADTELWISTRHAQ